MQCGNLVVFFLDSAGGHGVIRVGVGEVNLCVVGSYERSPYELI